MKNETAVSPVIGVLLMLTLTLIVAAIVNSYAGGLVETETKAPAVTLQASYHHDDEKEALKIRHISGDPIPTSSVKLFIRPSETFNKAALQQLSEVDKSYIANISDASRTWASGINAFKPGDIAVVTLANITETQRKVIKPDEESKYLFSTHPGNTFYLEMYYKNSLISRNEVLIE